MPNTKRDFGGVGMIIVILLALGLGAYFWSQKSSSQIVSVRISISTMNESVFSLLNGVTILGQKYLYPRDNGGALLNIIDPESGSMGDSCGDNVEATLEIANPKVEANHTTFQGDPTVTVDVVRIVSHDKPQRTCAY